MFRLVFLMFALFLIHCAEASNDTLIDELSVCIDDSDCQDDLGSRCFMVIIANNTQLFVSIVSLCFSFQYICYPMEDDSVLADSIKRRRCRRDSDCENGDQCFRHFNMRHVPTGICFAQVMRARFMRFSPHLTSHRVHREIISAKFVKCCSRQTKKS